MSRIQRHPPLLFVVLAPVIVACGNLSQPHPAVNLRSIALISTDVPRGYTRDVERFWTNEQAAARDHILRSTYDRHGRVRSFEDSYFPSYSGAGVARGLTNAGSEVTEYQTYAPQAPGRALAPHVSVSSAAVAMTSVSPGLRLNVSRVPTSHEKELL